MSLAHVNDTSTNVARPGNLTEGELDTLKRTIAHDLTNDELSLYAAVCKRSGLDPFAKQIYAIKRTTRRKVRGNWVEEDVLTIQTGIDGYRVIAERSQLYGGQDPPEWCGPDGVWTDVWLSDEPPKAARVAVYRKDVARPFVGVAKFDSYADRWPAKDGQALGDLRNLWKTMPEGQIAKCAEALALRKAFPNDLSGIYTTEEMEQADTPIHVRGGERRGIPAEQFREIVAASETLTDEQLVELQAWRDAEGLVIKPQDLTQDDARRVMERIVELGRGGGGGDEPGSGSAAAPPPPGSQDDGGTSAEVPSGREPQAQQPAPPEPAAAVTGGEADTPSPEHGEESVPPSGGVTVEQLLNATSATLPARQQLLVMRTARQVAAALSIPCPASPAEVAADPVLAAAVLHDLAGGDAPPSSLPASTTRWKDQDEAEWARWKNRCMAKAGPGTKAKPHPRILDEDKEVFDEQRHHLAWQASHKHRPGAEVESWNDVTEVEARAIEQALDLIKSGEALLTFDEGGRWVCQRTAAVA